MNSPIDPFAPIQKKGRTGADGNEEKCAGRIGEQNRLWTEASPFNLNIGFFIFWRPNIYVLLAAEFLLV